MPDMGLVVLERLARVNERKIIKVHEVTWLCADQELMLLCDSFEGIESFDLYWGTGGEIRGSSEPGTSEEHVADKIDSDFAILEEDDSAGFAIFERSAAVE